MYPLQDQYEPFRRDLMYATWRGPLKHQFHVYMPLWGGLGVRHRQYLYPQITTERKLRRIN